MGVAYMLKLMILSESHCTWPGTKLVKQQPHSQAFPIMDEEESLVSASRTGGFTDQP